MNARATGRARPLRRRAVTREQLIAAVEAGFLERGYYNASVEWLAGRAGYTTGAVYSSFGGKAGLFLAVLQRRSERLGDVWREAAEAEGAEETIAAAIAGVLDEPDYRLWTATFSEFAGLAARDPELGAALDRQIQGITESITPLLAPLAEKGRLPVDDFAQIVIAASNGLSLGPEAPPGRHAHLIRVLLERLTRSDSAR